MSYGGSIVVPVSMYGMGGPEPFHVLTCYGDDIQVVNDFGLTVTLNSGTAAVPESVLVAWTGLIQQGPATVKFKSTTPARDGFKWYSGTFEFPSPV